MGKQLRTSWVFWVNLIVLLIVIGEHLMETNAVPAQTMVLILGILNIVLRWFKTSERITGL
jgi:uncharacterized membrane protein (DUF485 family)